MKIHLWTAPVLRLTRGVPGFCHIQIIQESSEALGPVDIVYTWGVLHHTGDVWQAIHNAQLPLAEDGLLLVAVYADEFYDEKDNIIKMKDFYRKASMNSRSIWTLEWVSGRLKPRFSVDFPSKWDACGQRMDWCPWFQFSFCKLWILDKTLGWCFHQILDDLFSPATARYLLVEAPAEGRKEPFWGPAEFLWDARDGFLDWRAGLVGWMAHAVSGWQKLRWLCAMTDWGKWQRYRQQCCVVSFHWIDLDQRRKLLLG